MKGASLSVGNVDIDAIMHTRMVMRTAREVRINVNRPTNARWIIFRSPLAPKTMAPNALDAKSIPIVDTSR